MSDAVDVSCLVHVHTTCSDATESVEELVAAGADVVLVTDHDTLGAQRDGWEGRHGDMFVLVGTEISPRQGHYLACGVREEIPHAGKLAAVNSGRA